MCILHKQHTHVQDGSLKRAKKGDVAPTRGQFPCPAFGPHDSLPVVWRRFAGIFLESFPPFSFSSVLFSVILNPRHTISPALSV